MQIEKGDIVVQFDLPVDYYKFLIDLELLNAKAAEWWKQCREIVPQVKIIVCAVDAENVITLQVANANVEQIIEFNKLLRQIVHQKTAMVKE